MARGGQGTRGGDTAFDIEIAAADPQSRGREVHDPRSKLVRFPENAPLRLDCLQDLAPFQIAFQTYGTLNADRSNAILVCHALTADQHAANAHPVTGKPGWWDIMIGPGKPIDTDRFFVISSNILGGCMGSTGPASINPKTGKPYGLDFPVVTIADMVRAQARLIDHLGIAQLFSVVGGSMGGMQVLEWAARYSDRVYSAIPIATAAWHSAQNIAFHEVGRQAVMADPEWQNGRYLERDTFPRNGLAVARMAAHITYLSEDALSQKFGRNLQSREMKTFSFDADFQVESYLRHQGSTFVDRFDANSYLYITRALDYFDLEAEFEGKLANAFRGTRTRFCVVSFTSDWLYPTRESRDIVRALNAVAANVSFVEVESKKGHDAFLLEEPEFFATISGFLTAGAERKWGSRPPASVQAAGSGQQPAGRRDGVVPRPAARVPQPDPLPDSRVDHVLIADMVAPNSRVLDVGCGDGELLRLLAATRNVDGRGIEVSREKVNACVAQGLSVIQGDADRDLSEYPDGAFDYAILSLTIQATRFPKDVLDNLLRIGRHAIVSFPNFGHWRVRSQLMATGRMPITANLPEPWYLSPDGHLCTIKDFADLCRLVDARVERKVAFNAWGGQLGTWLPLTAHNFLGEKAVFLLTRQE